MVAAVATAPSARAAVPADGFWSGESPEGAEWVWALAFDVVDGGQRITGLDGGFFGPGGAFCAGGITPLSGVGDLAVGADGSFAASAPTVAVAGQFVSRSEVTGTYSFPDHPECATQAWSAHLVVRCFGHHATITGAGKIRGTPGADVIVGSERSDRITGRGGHDRMCAGSGKDAILVRDGDRDQVNCGPGVDTVVADQKDRTARNCERVRHRKRGPGK